MNYTASYLVFGNMIGSLLIVYGAIYSAHHYLISKACVFYAAIKHYIVTSKHWPYLLVRHFGLLACKLGIFTSYSTATLGTCKEKFEQGEKASLVSPDMNFSQSPNIVPYIKMSTKIALLFCSLVSQLFAHYPVVLYTKHDQTTIVIITLRCTYLGSSCTLLAAG